MSRTEDIHVTTTGTEIILDLAKIAEDLIREQPLRDVMKALVDQHGFDEVNEAFKSLYYLTQEEEAVC